jgi:hypothetical protein
VDDRRFDALALSFGRGGSRRSLLKGLLGFGGVAVAGGLVDDVEAARRPTPTPRPPTCPGEQTPCAEGCCCPGGTTTCGAACCPDGQAQCCDGACCYGTCYGEELCCEYPNEYCSVDGCCSGECVDEGRFCCHPANVCGDSCCDESEYCCTPSDGVAVCRGAGQCCVNSECVDGLCVDGTCVPLNPSFQISFTDVNFGRCSPIVEMSGFLPDTSYTYSLDLRSVPDGPPEPLFQYSKTTDGSGAAYADNVAEIFKETFEVRASMDQYSSDWVVVNC